MGRAAGAAGWGHSPGSVYVRRRSALQAKQGLELTVSKRLKVRFIGNVLETRSFLLSAWLGSQESSCFQPKLVTHPHINTPLVGKKTHARGFSWFGTDTFSIGSYPPCSRHYLFGKVWIRSSFLQINAFSQGCSEVGEVKGGQRSVMGVWTWPTKAVALHQPGPSRDVFNSPRRQTISTGHRELTGGQCVV